MWLRSHFVVFSVFTINYAKAFPLNIEGLPSNSPKNTQIDIRVDYTRVKATSFAAARTSSTDKDLPPFDNTAGTVNAAAGKRDRNELRPFSSFEQGSAGDAQSSEGTAFTSYSLHTTRAPLSAGKKRTKVTQKAPEPIQQYDQSYYAEHDRNDQSYNYAQGAITYDSGEAVRKPVQIYPSSPSINTDYSGGRLPLLGSYGTFLSPSDATKPAHNTDNVGRPDSRPIYAPDSRPIYAETTRRPPQIINYPPPQSYEESGRPSDNTNYQTYENAGTPSTSASDRNRIASQNYPMTQNAQGNFPVYQYNKPELSHVRDERPLLTPNQKIQIIIELPTENYNSTDFTTRAPLRRPDHNRHNKKNRNES